MAKRVNTKFLIGLTAAFGFLIVLAVAATVWSKFRRDPRAYERAGDEQVKEGRLREAVESYRFAAHKNPGNKDLMVKVGDTFNQMVSDDVQNLFAARAAWQQALANDPQFEPALRRLLDSYWEQAELSPFDADNYRRIHETAERLSQVRPEDMKVKARALMARVRPWIEGLPGAKPDEDAVKQLMQHMARDRSEPDVPYDVARHLLKRSREFRTRDQEADADRVFAQAGKVFDDLAADQGGNAALQLRAFQTYSRMDQIERAVRTERARRQATGVIVTNEPDAESPYAAKARKALAAAVEASKALPPEDTTYFEVQAQAGLWAAQEKRLEDCRRIFQDLLAKRPDDQRARLVYARLLSGQFGQRDEAIELLSRETKAARLVGPRGLIVNNLKVQTLIELNDARLEILRGRPTGAGGGAQATQAQAAGAPNAQQPGQVAPQGEQRQALLAAVKEDLKKLESLTSRDSLDVLRLTARLQQAEGDHVAAIQTYQRAAGIMEGMPDQQKNYDLLNELAVAYLQAGQTGNARELLDKIVYRYERYVQAHLQIAAILINENKLDDARARLKEAERQLARTPGDTPEYPRLRQEYDRLALMLLQKFKDPRLDQQFAELPEGTRVEKLGKATLALQLRKFDQAVRLAGAASKEDPKDLAALQLHVNALLAADRRAEAVAALDAAAAAHPELAERLKPARERIQATIELAKATPEEVYNRRRELILAEPESVARALKLVDLDRDFGKQAEAGEQLTRLHEQHPQDVQVTARLFELRLSEGRWNAAQTYLDKLAAAKADGADGLLYRFRMAMAKKEPAEALRLGHALVHARPEFDVSFVCRGQAYQAMGRYGEAIADFNAARRKRARNFDALRGIVDCYYAQNQPDEARALLNEARGLFPEDPLFREMELRHELEYGDPLAALSERERLMKERPDRVDSWLNLAAAYRQAARSKAVPEPKKAPLAAQARDLLQKGMARWPDEPRFVNLMSDVLLEAKDFAGGEKLLKDYAAGKGREGRYEPLAMLGDYYTRAGRLGLAEKAYREAIEKASAVAAAESGTPSGAAATAPAAAGTAAASAAVDLRMQLSTVLTMMGRFDDALAVLDEAGADRGAATNRRLFDKRLDVLVAAGRRDLAEQSLQDALAAHPDDLELQMALVRVNYDGGKFDEALQRVNNVIKAEPKNLVALFYRGQIRLRKPQPEITAAIADLMDVRKADPQNIATRVWLAEAYRQAGDTPKALRELDEGLRLQPASKDLRLKLMDLRSQPGVEDLNEILRLAGEARLNPQLKDDPVWAWRESLVHAARKDWPKAIAAIEDAVALAPNDMSLRREQQSVLLQAEQYKRVLELTDKQIADKTAPWWAYMYRGAARHGLKDDAGAVAEFNTALTAAGGDSAAVEQVVKVMTTTVGKDLAVQQVMARAEKDPRWKLLAAALHSIHKDWANATKMLDEVQAHFHELSDAQKVQALRISGPLYQLARPPQFDKARKAYEDLLKIQPDDLFALNNLATLLVDEAIVPQPQEAKQYSTRAYEQVKRAQPFPAAIFDTHGWVLIQCNQVDEGISILQKVVRQTTMPEAHYHLGEGYLKKRDPNKALYELRVAAEAIGTASGKGINVSPDLEKKIQAATEKANEMARAQRGGNAGAE